MANEDPPLKLVYDLLKRGVEALERIEKHLAPKEEYIIVEKEDSTASVS